MKTTLTLILLALTTGIYADSAMNTNAVEPDFQVLLSGLPDGEGRHIIEEGFSADESNPGRINITWVAVHDCVSNGTIWSYKSPMPRDFNESDSFINSKMTLNYYMCQNIDIEHVTPIDTNNCEKIASYNVATGFVVENHKINVVYTPNKIDVDASSVANHFPSCTPKPQSQDMQNFRASPFKTQG